MPPSGIHPRGAPRPTTSTAEQSLHRALAAQLPERWAAWHSLRIRSKDSVEGEGDFVLAIPDRGILVLEVKGGAIRVEDGQWLQNGVVVEPPRSQANRYVRKLVDKIQECRTDPPPFAVATVFPETAFSIPPPQGDMAGAVLGQQDLAHLDAALQEMAKHLFQGRPRPRSTEWMVTLHDLWGTTWTPRLLLGDRSRLREQELVALDQDQLNILEMVQDNTRVLVTGGAGTGKTLLAREMWRRLRAQGLRPVLLCSTSALASGLRAEGIPDAWTVRERAAFLLAEAGIRVQRGAPSSAWTPETWDLVPLEAAMTALTGERERYNAVVLDEGQDLAANDWELVRALAQDRPLWGFADAGQGFWAERHPPADLWKSTLRLVKRYRCPEPLARFADRYLGPPPGVPDGPVPELRVVRAPSEGILARLVEQEVHRAFSEHAERGDVAVLSLAGHARTALCSGAVVGSTKVVRADDPAASESVIADTFLRFKGLERPHVIITELGLGAQRYDVRMHIALTRATVDCVVVGTNAEIDADPRLNALCPRK